MSMHIKQAFFIAVSFLAVLPAQITLAQTQPSDTQANPEVDNRRAIVTRPNERARILSNMRKYLAGLQATIEALARDDMQAASAAARMMGSINLYEVKLMFPSKASIEFHNLAFEVHRDFDGIAKDAETKKDSKLMLTQLGTIMKKCTYCHETYKLQDMAH